MTSFSSPPKATKKKRTQRKNAHQMPPPLSTPPPSFGDLTYWNTRFSSEENFDWLVADLTIFEPVLRGIINGGKRQVTRVEKDDGGKDGGKKKTPQILHIGCGNSLLSFQLRGVVETAIQIHNCDYSPVVIKRQRQREKELLQTGSFGRAGGREVQSRWSVLDLLDPEQMANARRGGGEDGGGEDGGYDIIIDKSTTDAISCAEDVVVGLPYRINDIDISTSSNHTSPEKAAIYPPHILAIHLAYLARPGCRWVVLSYSSSRFSDWEGEEMPQGLPQPGELWKLVKHEKIVQPHDPEDKVHRPPEMHHLYILERTGVELKEV